MITDLLIIFLYVVSLALIWQFVGYPLFMGLVASKNKVSCNKLFLPEVSIVVPTYNESSVIEKRIENLIELDYDNSKYEIIVVDSGSTDNTSNIVEDLKKKIGSNYPLLKIVKEKKRNGKASAINLGKKESKFEVVLVTDANCTFEKNVLKEMMPHFKNRKIGAVGGRYCVENVSGHITESESFYWDLEFLMRSGEYSIDSACLFHGEINAWRKDLVNADINALSEDLDMCIKIRKKGYLIAYEPKAIVYEPSAINIDDQIKQRKRTTIGTIQNLFKHFRYLIIPNNLYSGFIFPSHKTLQVISPFLLIAMIILYFFILFIGGIKVVIFQLIFILGIFFVFLFSLIRFKSKFDFNKDKSGFSIRSIPKITYYVLINEYLILIAWKDFLFNKYSVLWEKVESSRK